MRCFEQPVPSPGPTKLANNGMHSSHAAPHTHTPQAHPTKASSANQWLYYCELCRSDILKRSARQEFEAARHERVWPSRPSPTPLPPSISSLLTHLGAAPTTGHCQDPLVVARLLVVGRDALMQMQNKVSTLKPAVPPPHPSPLYPSCQPPQLLLR